ncbi:potassium efflux system KefA protein [Geminocystis sp. NIES-3708]|uniref:mechanosensitive ion channel family protein n=1 Tax=Geminocystis sp. NIES-3708 TaxID=1615909 RepID=UPI0005FCD437|nr:mechanosensitive ion channel domain-containing protein [Geminocystis sp. NIES-3708]BAQ60637.1 potassium efflux system KefA protein [Geminocystis sp. NIES-3708]
MESKVITFSDILLKQSIFFSRSDILIQSLVIVFTLILSWLLSKVFWRWLHQKIPQFTTFIWRDEKLEPNEYIALFLQSIDFPLITLILLNLIEAFFDSQSWTIGLINLGETIVVVYLILRCLLAFLYSTFPLNIIREYQWKIFYPLFILFVFRKILELSGNFAEFSDIVVIKLFNNPVTFQSIFTLFIGLYFWLVIVTLLENLLITFIKPKTASEKGEIQATILLIRYFLITLGIVLILGYVGVDGRAITAISGGLSVGIGFALKEVISNFVSGIILLFEKVLKPGDIISIEGQTCEVKELGIRATTVRMTIDNSEKIIPNQIFFTEDLTTYTGTNNLVYCSILIGVGYNSKPEQVMNLLLEIAYDNKRVLKSPSPIAFFLNFGDSSLNFELKFWLDDINIRKGVISELNCKILKEFSDKNIEIPYPQRDIYIKNN